MAELKTHVPTYNGNLTNPAARDALPEFGDPHVPIMIRRSDGLRIVLGSFDYFDFSVPNIQIERRPQGWAFFLHPVGDGDPSGFIYFLDDGRSFVVPETSELAIRMAKSTDDFPELDTLPKDARQKA